MFSFYSMSEAELRQWEEGSMTGPRSDMAMTSCTARHPCMLRQVN